jgi:spermidine/putrescine-binding protein
MKITNKRKSTYFAALAAASALLLSACGGESTATDTASAPATAAAGEFPPSGSGVVNLYNWSDYIEPALLEEFTKEKVVTKVACAHQGREPRSARH